MGSRGRSRCTCRGKEGWRQWRQYRAAARGGPVIGPHRELSQVRWVPPHRLEVHAAAELVPRPTSGELLALAGDMGRQP